MQTVKGYWVVLGLFGVMSVLWATRYYLASSPSIPGPRYFQLTQPAGRTLEPTLSPDGRQIAFVSDKSGQGNLDLWVRQVGGGESIQITHEPGDERDPAFTADGLRLGYTAPDGLYSVDLRGSPPVRLVEGGSEPSFSPDGHFMAYVYKEDVYILPTAGGSPRRIAPGTTPAWSDDNGSLLLNGAAGWTVVTLANNRTYTLPGHGPARWYRGYAYYTEGGQIKRIPLATDGTPPGPPETLTAGTSPSIAGLRLVYLQKDSIFLTNLPSGR